MMKRINAFVSLLILCSMYFGMLAPFAAHAQRTRPIQKNMNEQLPDGLKFRLSEGVEGAENREKQPPASGENLSESEASNLLKRVPPVKEQTDDKTDFAKRVGTLPAPKTGEKIPVKFPSDEMRGTPKINVGSTLEVVRFSPEGEVSLAPDLSVTFSQPMVAVTSQEQAAQTVPVQITPQPEGKWRWLGTRTLMFDTTKRFPMATKFTAKIPAGTKGINGQTLAKDVTWTFTTPPPKVEQMIPQNQTTRRDAPVFISFDQEINPDAVLRTIKVSAGGKIIPIRLATQEEIDKDSSINYYIKQSQPKRWLAFRAVNSDGLTENALPADSAITVNVTKGTPSAEGPLTTTKDQSFLFRTFGAMKFTAGYCGWRENKKCSPFENWMMEFSNQIDAQTFDKSMVKVEPAVEELNIFPSGNYVIIGGYKKGRTTYKVSVDTRLKDIYGQNLIAPATATIAVGAADANLYSQGGNFVVLDPTARPAYSIYSTNHASAKVKIYRVQPTDWHQFQNFIRYRNYDDGTKKQPIPGKLVADKVVKIENKLDEMVETRIDLSEYLDGGFGHLVVQIEPTVRRDKYDRTEIIAWTAATQIGIDAFVDNQELVGFVTDLKTGKPISGADLTIYPNGKNVWPKATSENQTTESWMDWFYGLFASNEKSSGPSATDENGETINLETVPEAQSNATTDNGILRLPLPDSQSPKQNILIARKGKDVSFLPENTDYYWQDNGNWHKKPSEVDSLQWFVFDDRKMYRPKEEVAVKGYIRVYQGGKFGDIQPLGDRANGLTYSVRDSRGNEIGKGTTNLNAFGAFDFKFKLPDNANLGYSQVILTTNSSVIGGTHYHQFQIQEFRRPEFEVSAKNETEAPYFVGGSANVSVEAKYFAGGGLANAETNWVVNAVPTNYTPPNRGDFTFGTWIPWWRIYDYEGGIGRPGGGGGNTQTFKGVTDASGKHVLKIDFESVKPPRPYSVTANASVQDVNRQTWAASTSLLVHPSTLYVGLKIPRYFVQKGENIEVESIVSDIDGKLIAGRDVEIKAVLKDWQFDKGAWKEVAVDEQTCMIKSSEKPEKCKFVAKQGGRYTITARVFDDRERPNETEITVWVAGGKTPPKRNVEQEEAQLIPDKKEYKAGDTAEILVMSPFTGAEGVLTLRRDGLVKTERFTIKDSSVTLKIPIEEKYLPNLHVQADLVGAAVRTNDKGEADEKLAKRPAFAKGNLNLSISTATRELTVSAEPQAKSLEPGGTTKINLEVKDNKGEPVANTEVAVIVVDESVLALSNYRIGNPLDTFYTQRGDGVIDYHLRKDILLGNERDLFSRDKGNAMGGMSNATMANVQSLPMKSRRVSAGVMNEIAADKAEYMMESPPPPKPVAKSVVEKELQDPINLRTNFNALALFLPSVKTGTNGKATVDVKLPDNLTRYRIMAVSVDGGGKRFGSGESNLTARQPLMVRPSAPRFMNFGDKIELPVVLQNQTDNPLTVDVAVRATNATLTAGNGRKVVVPANDRVEVRFPVSAEKAGTARFQIVTTSGKFADAAEIELPVWTPATTEAFATYGTTDKNGAIVQPVEAPKDVYPQFGGLELTTSSTQLQELTDAFIYLQNYPFECSEQVASRMISIAALRDVLKAFKSKDMPSDEALEKRFARDVEILKSRQQENGYFGMWKRDGERYKYPFVTAHVAHALVLAKAKGYKIPEEMLTKVKPYLKNIESHYEGYYPKEVRWTISAYALYVRNVMGDKDAVKAKKLLAEAGIEKMPFEALGWILSVLADDKNSQTEVANIVRFLMNRTTETAATANFVTDYGDGAWLIMYSNRRADGVLLEALLKAQGGNATVKERVNSVTKNTLPNGRVSAPDTSELIPKLVRGLLAQRTKGAWSNTQENVFILLALDKYFEAYEKVTPDFVTRVWLGNVYAGEQLFKGRSVDSNLLNIPMNYLIEQGGASNLILDKQGAGRLYYRIGMKYAPKNLKLEPADYGFTVLRKYEAVDNADDVKQNTDGSWTIKSGARVRVRLTMVAQARRYHVALVDNLPAGLEILNPELAVTESIPQDTQPTTVDVYSSRSYGYGWWWRMNWFEHQNFRDERAEAFAGLLWEGVYNYSYVTRATTPGEFVVPPAKAEEMYHPENFGRTGTDFVKVE